MRIPNAVLIILTKTQLCLSHDHDIHCVRQNFNHLRALYSSHPYSDTSRPLPSDWSAALTRGQCALWVSSKYHPIHIG